MGRLSSIGPRISGPLLALGLAAGACTNREEPAPDNGPGTEDPVLNLPAVPRPEPPLDRAGLLAAVARAASATAAGSEVKEERQLDGRQFEVRIRFGCRGPAQDLENAWLGWSFDPERRRLRVRARPTIAASDELVARAMPGEHEEVEGFWIPRPWLLDAVCPAGAAVATPAGQDSVEDGARDEEPKRPSGTARDEPRETPVVDPIPRSPRVGIAQFFDETDPRTGRRRGRAFEAFKTLEEGELPGSQGFTLVLSGRLRSLPGIGVIGCSARGPDSAPECIVSAQFDRVWIEQPETGEVVSEWRSV